MKKTLINFLQIFLTVVLAIGLSALVTSIFESLESAAFNHNWNFVGSLIGLAGTTAWITVVIMLINSAIKDFKKLNSLKAK